MNVDSANSEVSKWIDNKANKRIHSTTLQQPSKLLQDEMPHLLSLPKPYNGIHPKSSNNVIIKDSPTIKSNVPLGVIHIPNRDLNDYDSLIPILLTFLLLAINVGALLWN